MITTSSAVIRHRKVGRAMGGVPARGARIVLPIMWSLPCPIQCASFGIPVCCGHRHPARIPRNGASLGARHLDELLIRIRGVLRDLWRAVDQHGVVVPGSLVPDRRNGAAAQNFFKHRL